MKMNTKSETSNITLSDSGCINRVFMLALKSIGDNLSSRPPKEGSEVFLLLGNVAAAISALNVAMIIDHCEAGNIDASDINIVAVKDQWGIVNPDVGPVANLKAIKAAYEDGKPVGHFKIELCQKNNDVRVGECTCSQCGGPSKAEFESVDEIYKEADDLVRDMMSDVDDDMSKAKDTEKPISEITDKFTAAMSDLHTKLNGTPVVIDPGKEPVKLTDKAAELLILGKLAEFMEIYLKKAGIDAKIQIKGIKGMNDGEIKNKGKDGV